MDTYTPLVELIAAMTKTEFRAASETSLSSLRGLGVPDSVIRFYERHEPGACAENPSVVRLWPVREMVVENTQGVPGICVRPFGYVVFASTMCGDAYCFNLNRLNADREPEIALIAVDDVGEGSKADEVHASAKRVARTLYEFLTQFSRDEVDQGHNGCQ